MVYLFFPVADLVLNATITFAVLDVKGEGDEAEAVESEVVDAVMEVRLGRPPPPHIPNVGGCTTTASVPSVQSVGT